MRDLTLTPDDLRLLVEALDSHEYWQLSEPFYRRDGYVTGDGADDADAAGEIARARRLRERIEGVISESRR